MNGKNTRPIGYVLLLILVVFQGLSGIFGGIGLVLDPSGQSLQIPIEWLEGSPFHDYLIPGLILFVILGIYPLILLIGLAKKSSWAWLGSLFLGVALIIWIGVEVLIVGYQTEPPLQLIYGSVGMLVLLLSMLPSVKKTLS